MAKSWLKTALLASVMAGAVSAPAVAADLYAPRPGSIKDDGDYRPRFSWTGFYLGVNAGYTWGNYRVRNTAEGNQDGFDEGIVGLTYKLEPAGFVGGVHGGYNWQVSNVVLGVEGDLSFSDANDSAILLTVPPDDFARTRLGTHGTITARAGLAMGRWMPFIKGGVAIGEVKVNAGDIIDGTNIIDPADVTQKKSTRTGWTIGAGLEHALTNNWLIKVEYNYIDLGSFKSTNLDGDIFKHSLDTHTVKAGISYKF